MITLVAPKSAHGNEISPSTPKKERAYRELIVVKPVKIPVDNDLVDSYYTLKNDDKIKVFFLYRGYFLPIDFNPIYFLNPVLF